MKERLLLPPGLDGEVWHYQWKGHPHPRHRHDELELNLVIRGRARYLLGDRRYDLRTNFQVWLFPAQEHVMIDQSPDFSMWIAVFKPALLKRVCAGESLAPLRQENPGGLFCRGLPQPRARQVHALLDQIHAAHAQPAQFNAGLSYALLFAWQAHLDATQLPLGHDVHPSVERAARIVYDDDQNRGVDQVAHEAGLSPARLSHLFKKQMGVPLATFRNQRRLERFMSIYGTGQRVKMLSAALQAGFGSYAQFHRVFKQLTGMSPAAYRKSLAIGAVASA